MPSPVLVPFSLGVLPTRLLLSASKPAALTKVTGCQMQSPFSSCLLTSPQHLNPPEHALLLGTLSHLGFQTPHGPGSSPTSMAAPSHAPLLVSLVAQYLNLELPKLSPCTYKKSVDLNEKKDRRDGVRTWPKSLKLYRNE